MSNKTLIPYMRFSSDGQTDNTSIPRQETAIHAYALKMGYDINKAFTFKDEAVSASTGKHIDGGQLSVLIDKLQNGSFGDASNVIICCYSLDRLTRLGQTESMIRIIYPIVSSGAEIHTTNDGKVLNLTNLDEIGESLFLNINLYQNKELSRKISENVRGAYIIKFDALQTNGDILRICLPSWLTYTDDTKTVIAFKEPEIHSVRMICKLALQGFTCTAIAQELIDNNIPILGKSKTTAWTVGAVNQIMKNNSLYGRFYSATRDLTIDDYYPAVINKLDFDTIEAYRNRRTHNGRGKRSTNKGGKVLNMFVGLLTCDCGCSMSINQNGNNHYALRCSGRAMKTGCTNRQVHYANFEQLMLTFITTVDLNSIFNPKQDSTELDRYHVELSKLNTNIDNISNAIEQEYSAELSKILRGNVATRDTLLLNIKAVEITTHTIPDIKCNIENLLLQAGNHEFRSAYKAKLSLIVSKIVIDTYIGIGNSRTIRVYYVNGEMSILNLNIPRRGKTIEDVGSLGLYIDTEGNSVILGDNLIVNVINPNI